MLRVVLDANVYVSAIIRSVGPPGRIIERFLRTSAFENILSPATIEETIRALRYPKVRKAVRREIDPVRWFEDLMVLSTVVAGARVVTGASRDPEDDKYVAAAVEGDASLIVSGDPDLLTLREYAGIQILSPRAFLERLGPA